MSPRGPVATRALEGSPHTAKLLCYLEKVLCPVPRPGQSVILGNLPAHRNRAVRARIEAAGCRPVFLPAYSPDFNPVEHAFAKLKAFLCKTKARTRETLEEAIAPGLDTITCQDACGWFKHCEFPLHNPLS